MKRPGAGEWAEYRIRGHGFRDADADAIAGAEHSELAGETLDFGCRGIIGQEDDGFREVGIEGILIRVGADTTEEDIGCDTGEEQVGALGELALGVLAEGGEADFGARAAWGFREQVPNEGWAVGSESGVGGLAGDGKFRGGGECADCGEANFGIDLLYGFPGIGAGRQEADGGRTLADEVSGTEASHADAVGADGERGDTGADASDAAEDGGVGAGARGGEQEFCGIEEDEVFEGGDDVGKTRCG